MGLWEAWFWDFALVGWWWQWWRCRSCSSSPKAKLCWHNAGGQIINQFYWRVVKNKCCNMIWWNQADQLSGFPAGLYLSVVTVTLPPRPHKSFSGPGKVIPSKPFTNRSGSGCWTWDLGGLFFCSDQIDISGGEKVILEPFLWTSATEYAAHVKEIQVQAVQVCVEANRSVCHSGSRRQLPGKAPLHAR